MTTVLLTLGRLPKALALARACRALGCRVIVAEPFRWHLCRVTRAVARSYRVTAPNRDEEQYLDELLAIVAAEDVDLVLPVSEEALHVAALAPRLPSTTHLFGSDRATLFELHSKLRFIRLAARLGLPVPETHLANSDGALTLSRERDFVEKPLHSCSGIGVRLADAGESLSGRAPELLVQERLYGEHLSSLSLVSEGREIVTVVYRGTVLAGTVAVCFERVDGAPSVHDWVSRFIAAYPCSGFIAMDFVVDDDGVARALECNPRVTSGVHFFAPQSLGAALLNPAACSPIELTTGTRFQWAYSTLTEAYAALLRPREFLRRMGELFSARDVVWELSDPLPFLLMTPLSWEILWPAITSPMSLGEATQRDIAWFGGRGSDTPAGENAGDPG